MPSFCATWKSNSPRPQRARHLLQGLVERRLVRPVEAFGQEAIVGRVVAHREEQRVRHVGLEADRLRPVHHLQQLDVALSRCACRPSRSPLRRRAARRWTRRCRRPSGRCRRSSSCCRRDPWPIPPGWRPSRCGRRRSGGRRGLRASGRSRTPCAPASGTPSARRRCPSPIRRRSAATPARPASRPSVSCARILSASRCRSSLVESMLTCGSNRNRSTPSNFVSSGARLRGQVEHRVEVDRRLGIRSALADQSRPHRVV